MLVIIFTKLAVTSVGEGWSAHYQLLQTFHSDLLEEDHDHPCLSFLMKRYWDLYVVAVYWQFISRLECQGMPGVHRWLHNSSQVLIKQSLDHDSHLSQFLKINLSLFPTKTHILLVLFLWEPWLVYTSYHNTIFFFNLAAPCITCSSRDLCCSKNNIVLWPGIEPGAAVLGMHSFNHWTTREVLTLML